MDFELDKIDRQIIKLLMKDSRMPYAEMARRLHLSRVAVRERVNSLLKRGVIEEFTIVVNSQAFGYYLNVFLEIQVKPHMLHEVAEKLAKDEKVFVVYQMTGATTLHVHAFVEGTEQLDQFMKERVYSIPGIVQVHSHILIARYKSDLRVR